MKKLNFSKEYKKILASGKKKTTIRLKTNLRRGDKALVIVGGEKIGIAKIMAVSKKKFSELTLKDAKMDGFKTLKELRKALEKHYGRISPNTELKIIHFKLKMKGTK